jgi:hypothetical protein
MTGEGWDYLYGAGIMLMILTRLVDLRGAAGRSKSL